MQGDVRYPGYHHGTSGAGMIAVEDAEGNTIGVVRHVVVDSPTGLSWASSDPGLRTLPAACCSPPSTRTRGVGLAAAPGTSPPTPSGRVPPARPRSRVRTAIGATGNLPYRLFTTDHVANWGEQWCITRQQVLVWLAAHRRG